MDCHFERSEIDEWREAKEDEVDAVLTRERPESIYIHNLVKGSLKWSRACPEMKTTLYVPKNTRWQGSVIVNIKGPVNTVAIFSPHASYSFILSALIRNNIIDWKSGPMVFCGIPHELFIPFEQSFRSFGVPVVHCYVFNRYWLEAKTARKLELSVPEGYSISRLHLDHASVVNSVWPYASKESLKLISDMIRINPSVGLFAGENSKLVSWILQTYYGLGMLHTIDEYRRKGLGETVVKTLAKYLGDEGNDVTLLVRENNKCAKSIFERLEFTDLGLIGILQVSSES